MRKRKCKALSPYLINALSKPDRAFDASANEIGSVADGWPAYRRRQAVYTPWVSYCPKCGRDSDQECCAVCIQALLSKLLVAEFTAGVDISVKHELFIILVRRLEAGDLPLKIPSRFELAYQNLMARVEKALKRRKGLRRARSAAKQRAMDSKS